MILEPRLSDDGKKVLRDMAVAAGTSCVPLLVGWAIEEIKTALRKRRGEGPKQP